MTMAKNNLPPGKTQSIQANNWIHECDKSKPFGADMYFQLGDVHWACSITGDSTYEILYCPYCGIELPPQT